MAGDADYTSLIEKLTEKGHEVRIVCNNKNIVSKVLKNIIPVIIDREMIIDRMKRLQNQLYQFMTLVNYLLSLEEQQSLSIDELINEIQKHYFKNLNYQLTSYLNLLQNFPDYNWQYRFYNNVIQKLPLPPPSKANDPIQSRAKARKTAIYFKLGYEDESDNWLEIWREFKTYETDPENQKTTLMTLYQTIAIPKIRNYIQRELVKLLLVQQATQPSNDYATRIFKERKDVDALIADIEKSLQQHSRAVHTKKKPPFLCKICGKNLMNEISVQSHTRQAHSPGDRPLPFECNICFMRLKTKNGLEDHKSKKH